MALSFITYFAEIPCNTSKYVANYSNFSMQYNFIDFFAILFITLLSKFTLYR